MATNGSYSGNDKIQGNSEIEYASDPAAGGFFHSDYKKSVSYLSNNWRKHIEYYIKFLLQTR